MRSVTTILLILTVTSAVTGYPASRLSGTAASLRARAPQDGPPCVKDLDVASCNAAGGDGFNCLDGTAVATYTSGEVYCPSGSATGCICPAL